MTCPICGSKMVQRTGGLGTFWGCSQFPKCRGTRSLNEEVDTRLLDKSLKEQQADWDNNHPFNLDEDDQQ